MGDKKMTWEQMLQAMQALERGTNPRMIQPGDWVCALPGEIGGDGMLITESGHGDSPKNAVIDAWSIIKNLPNDRYLLIRDGSCVQWDGFMWVELDEDP